MIRLSALAGTASTRNATTRSHIRRIMTPPTFALRRAMPSQGGPLDRLPKFEPTQKRFAEILAINQLCLHPNARTPKLQYRGTHRFAGSCCNYAGAVDANVMAVGQFSAGS